MSPLRARWPWLGCLIVWHAATAGAHAQSPDGARAAAPSRVAPIPTRSATGISSQLAEPASCVARAVTQVLALGARVEGEPRKAFLLQRESRSFPIELKPHGCIGLLVIAAPAARDVDLFLHTAGGVPLREDQGTDSHPYISYCGPAGGELIATVRMHEGRGEVHLVQLRDAPPTLEALDEWLAGCAGAGGGIELAEVGPEPEDLALEDALDLLATALQPMGYRGIGGAELGHLPARRRETMGLRLEAGRCYALAALGRSIGSIIDLRVLSPLPNPQLVGADSGRGRHAIAKFCAPTTGVYIADLRMLRGVGHYALQAFELDEGGERLPPGVDGHARIAFVEQSAKLRSRGLKTRPIAWGLVSPGDSLSVPITLSAGQCYALAIVPDEPTGDLDLTLLDQHGSLVAWDVGPGPQPIVFHCAARDGLYHAVGSAHGAPRYSRYLLVLGEEHDLPRGAR